MRRLHAELHAFEANVQTVANALGRTPEDLLDQVLALPGVASATAEIPIRIPVLYGAPTLEIPAWVRQTAAENPRAALRVVLQVLYGPPA